MAVVRMAVNQTAVGSARMPRVTVMSRHAPLKPGGPRVRFAHPTSPVVMSFTVVGQAHRSASPLVTAMVPGQPEMPARAMGFNVPGGITDTGTGSAVPA